MRGYFKILAIVISFIVISQIASSVIPQLTVNETDLVKIDVKTLDLDEDEVEIEYGNPLNSSGEWQTTYGDYGEYLINISASDGELKSTQKFRLIVNKVNWPPEIEELDDIIIDEGDTITISPKVEDPEYDDIQIYISAPIGNDGIWNTTFEDAGEYEVKVSASDGKNSVSETFILTVKNINQIPKINSFFPKEEYIEIQEGSSQEFEINASDPDKEKLRYIWEIDEEQVSKESSYTYTPDYDSEGDHKITVFVSDKETTKKHSWTIKVLNTNRPPVLDEMPDIIVDETDTIEIEISASDPDDDLIYYSISEPIGDDKLWETTYDDQGEYTINLTVSDGQDEVETQFNVIVNNIDRSPLFEKIEDQEVVENQELRINLNALDPDDDEITFIAENAPIGAKIIDGVFYYTPTYNVVKKSGTIIDTIYDELRLDAVFPRNKKTFNVLFIAESNDLQAKQTVKITVIDKNQPPYLMDLEDMTVNELEAVTLIPEAFEYDNDQVKFYISEPIGNDGKWTPTYDDAGEYEISVMASDGKDSDTKTFLLTVNNVNRQPEIELKEQKVNENEELVYTPEVKDEDGDEIYLSLEDAPEGAELVDNELTWTPSYEKVDKQRDHFLNKLLSRFPSLSKIFSTNLEGYTVELSATDDEDIVTEKTVVIVKDVNRIPVLNDFTPISVFETHVGSSVLFSVDASDPDNDNLTYTWKFNNYQMKYKDVTKIKRTFTVPGIKTVKVYIDDGYTAIVKMWKVKVLPKESTPAPTRTRLTETYIVDNVEDSTDSGIIQFEI